MEQQSSSVLHCCDVPHGVTKRGVLEVDPPAPSTWIVSPQPPFWMPTTLAPARQAVCMLGYVFPSHPHTLQKPLSLKQPPQLPIGLQ
jgi:hypothetical protein